MYKRIFSILIIIIVIGISFFTLAYFAVEKREKIVLKQDRIFRPIFLINKLDLNGNYSLIKVFNDRLFFTSWDENLKGKIYMLKENEKIISERYNFQDKISAIGNYYIDNDTVTFYDEIKYPKRLFKFNKKQYCEWQLNAPIHKMEFSNDGFMQYSLDSLKFPSIFHHADTMKEMHLTYNFKELKYPGIQLDGIFRIYENKTFMIPFVLDKIFIFNNDTNIHTNTIELINRPRNFQFFEKNGILMYDSNNSFPNISMDLQGDKVYVLTNETGIWDHRGRYFVDVYDTKDGKYLFSYLLNFEDKENLPKEIVLKGDNFYLLSNKYLYKYDKNIIGSL